MDLKFEVNLIILSHIRVFGVGNKLDWKMTLVKYQKIYTFFVLAYGWRYGKIKDINITYISKINIFDSSNTSKPGIGVDYHKREANFTWHSNIIWNIQSGNKQIILNYI